MLLLALVVLAVVARLGVLVSASRARFCTCARTLPLPPALVALLLPVALALLQLVVVVVAMLLALLLVAPELQRSRARRSCRPLPSVEDGDRVCTPGRVVLPLWLVRLLRLLR